MVYSTHTFTLTSTNYSNAYVQHEKAHGMLMSSMWDPAHGNNQRLLLSTDSYITNGVILSGRHVLPRFEKWGELEYPKSNLLWNVSLFSLLLLPQISKCWKYVLPGSGPAVLRTEFRNPGYQACKAQQTALRNLAMWTFTLLLAEEKHFWLQRSYESWGPG